MVKKQKQRKGFALLSPQRRRLLAALGGKSAQIRGVAHQFTHEQAVVAGRKGGLEVARKHPEHLKNIGKIGGSRRWNTRNKNGS